ncbi:MAG: hypothetical protein EB127_21500 [Alphaproteobacteria bacterium]|nr:hypothetical protein [Alphaproteobacteria bacterium]
MKFSKVIGNVDPKLVEEAEEKLTAVFLELGTRYDNTAVGSGIGGDPLIFSLLYPMEHICTLNMPTAGTDGKRYYWNPKFVLKQDRIGLRIVSYHEAGHAMYMHPQRRGSRLPKLWNIAVDYLVNGMCMDDFKTRNFNAAEMFQKHLGNYITLSQYAEMLKDPWNNKGPGGDITPPDIKWPEPGEDRELTEEEKKALDEYEKKVKCFFADPDLEDDMKNPEKIYDYLYSLLPKCDTCGSVGVYKKPQDQNAQGNGQGDNQQDGSSDQGKSKGKKGKKGKKQDQQQANDPNGQGSCGGCNDPNHNHGKDGDACGCPDCGGGYDIFGFGDTLDEHMDTEESEEKLAKRMSDAMEAAKKMAGHVPAAIEAELGKLTEPKITWTDIIRGQIARARAGNDRNDWTRFRTRPLFAGILTPKRKNYQANFACLVDCSGSMSKDDIAFGLSQLKALDSRSEGILVPADSEIYWDKSTKIRACNDEELTKFKRVGLGGTMFSDFFTNYEKEIGKQDFLVIITDGFLLDTDIASMINPAIPVFWVVTSKSMFNAPFGKVFDLN